MSPTSDGSPTSEPQQAQGDLARLLERCAEGDKDAFAGVYDQTAGRVHAITRRVVRDVAQAEEVTQEVMLDVWRKAATFDAHRGNALSWILTIAHRRAVDRVRASQSQSERDDVYESRASAPAQDPTAEEATGHIESTAVRRAVAKLSEGQRQALELAYFQGLSHSEVAEALGIPLGTAKTRVRDGLIKLRHLMKDEGRTA